MVEEMVNRTVETDGPVCVVFYDYYGVEVSRGRMPTGRKNIESAFRRYANSASLHAGNLLANRLWDMSGADAETRHLQACACVKPIGYVLHRQLSSYFPNPWQVSSAANPFKPDTDAFAVELFQNLFPEPG